MQRMRATEPLRALVTGREAAIEQALRPEAAPTEDGPARARPAGIEPPVPVAAPPAPLTPARAVRRLLGSRRSLRQVMLAQEVLGPPRSLRPEERLP
jgi:hypothetical protein